MNIVFVAVRWLLARGGAVRRKLAALASLACLWPLSLGLPAVAEAAAPPAAAKCPPVAEPLTSELLASGMRVAQDHGFFWRISKDGRSSYLYGTIHAARLEWMFPGPTVQDALRDSDVVALELDVLDSDVQQRLMASIGSTRKEPLPPALAQRLDKRRAAECVDAATFDGFAPEFQIASLSVLAGRRDGLDPSYAVDLVLAGVARSLSKPVVSLETPEAQMAALQMPTQKETIAFVKSGLDDLDSGRARPLINRIAKAWAGSDYATLNGYGSWCDCLRTPVEKAAMKRLLDDRNPILAEGIDRLHASGKQVFAAVGSLHMVGPMGLPELMRKRGYTVEQGEFAK